MEVIDSSGRSRPSVTKPIPRLRWAARGLWVATLAVAAYNIGTSETPWWQSGREAANIAGGVAGGFAGGAAMGAAGGALGGPIGVGVGIVVGGILGALLADHAYVEAVGVNNPATRQFIDRFSSFFTGFDSQGLARALARERSNDPVFTRWVFESLADTYTLSVDNVALAYVNLAKQDAKLKQMLWGNRDLREMLIRFMDDGWTTAAERDAINFLRKL